MVPCAGFPTVHVTITNSSSSSNLCLYQPFSCFVQLLEFLGLTPHWKSTSYCQGTLKKYLTLFSCSAIFRASSGLKQICSLIVYFCLDIYLEDVSSLWASTDAPFVHSASSSAPNMEMISLRTDEIEVNPFIS